MPETRKHSPMQKNVYTSDNFSSCNSKLNYSKLPAAFLNQTT